MVWYRVVDKFTDKFVKSIFIKFEKTKTDTFVFRLHYKLAVWLVFFYSVCYTYFSQSTSISCMGSKGENGAMFIKAVNDYCWIHGTSRLTNPGQMYPGILGLKTGPISDEDKERKHPYYKWMYFNMIVMIVLLHTPRHIWYSIENGMMGRLVGKLSKVVILAKDDEIEKEKDMLVEYLKSHLGYHRCYSYGLAFCELLNVLVSAMLMLMWDRVTGHELSMNGADLLGYLGSNPGLRTDALSTVFPLMGKCTFKKVGPSGNIQPLDFVCLLPLNILNERSAVFFWFFFMSLVAVGASSLVFRLAMIISTRFRTYLLSEMCTLTPLEDIEFLTENCSYADWFVIYKMGSNLEPMVFRLVLQQFIGKLKGLRAIVRV